MEQLPKTPSASGEQDTSQPNGMNNDFRQALREVTGELARLEEKIDGQKKRDRWDKFQIISSFCSTFLLAAVGLVFTFVYNHGESIRQANMQKANIRVAELQAILTLTPLLTSKDEEVKRITMMTLRSLEKSSPVSKTSAKESETLLDTWVKIALSGEMPDEKRSNATKEIAAIALDASAPPNIREKATEAVTKIAASHEVPQETREIANEALKQIRAVNAKEISRVVADQENSRKIDEVILHHSSTAINQYKGAETIFSVAKFMLSGLYWNAVGWHYAIAPDGDIWIGTPLGKVAPHTGGRNATSVGIMLFMDGDKELPTEEQKKVWQNYL